MEQDLKHYRVIGADGSVQFRTVPAGALPPRWEPGCPRPVQVPRLPNDFEDWDEQEGRFILNHAKQADAQAGPEHIARAHALKAIEAVLIKSGLSVDGLLAAEAAALGTPLPELVEQVLSRTDALIAEEVARRLAKKKALLSV